MLKINSVWVKISFAAFALSFAIEAVTGYTLNPAYKYIFMISTCAVAALLLCCAPRDTKILWNVFVNQGACAVVFILASLLALFVNGFRLYPDFTRDLFRLFGPALMAFLLYNVDHSSDNMDFYFITFFITETVGYFLTDILPELSIESIMSISLADSYSPFENMIASRFTVFLVYFIIRKKPLLSVIALAANIFTFKRFNMLFAILFFLFGWILRDTKRRVPDRLVNITIFAFCLAPVLLMFFISDTFVGWFETAFDTDFNEFTMGRFEQYIYIFDYHGSLLGLGSTKYILADRAARGGYAEYLHSDLLRFYVETTFFGLITYVASMFNHIKIRKRYFTYITMVFLFALMLITPNFGDFPVYFMIFLICQIDFSGREEAGYSAS